MRVPPNHVPQTEGWEFRSSPPAIENTINFNNLECARWPRPNIALITDRARAPYVSNQT